MALSLSTPTVTQSNDAVTINITDTTGEYNASTNPGGWGSPNPAVTDIDGSTYHLYLDVVYTDSDGNETTYDQIEVSDTFSTIEELSFDITPDMLTSEGVAMGSSTDEFNDGWYEITYSFVDDGSTYDDSSIVVNKLIDGVVKNSVYLQVKSVPYINEFKRFSNDFKEWSDILYPLYYLSLLEGMESEAVVSRKNEVISMLKTLEILLAY